MLHSGMPIAIFAVSRNSAFIQIYSEKVVMADQANIINKLQSNIAGIGPFTHDNRSTVFFDSASGSEYNGATKTTQKQPISGRWKASTTGFMPGCATAVQALRNTSWSHLPLNLERVRNLCTRPTSARVGQQPQGSKLHSMRKNCAREVARG